MTHETSPDNEQPDRRLTLRERARDVFFRLGLADVNSQGEMQPITSRIDSAEGGDLKPVRALHQRIIRNPYPQAQLEVMAQRNSTSEDELPQRLERIERMGKKHEERRKDILARDAEGATLEPGEVAELNTTQGGT